MLGFQVGLACLLAWPFLYSVSGYGSVFCVLCLSDTCGEEILKPEGAGTGQMDGSGRDGSGEMEWEEKQEQ